MNNEVNYLANNKVFLCGEVEKEPVYSHELFSEGFYEFLLKVPRLSDQSDYIPLTISERIMSGVNLSKGTKIAIDGQFRSYNKLIDDRSKLMLTVFVRDFLPAQENEQNPNVVEICGYICKPTVYRTTPFNREICDVLLAVNRAYSKSDYIPCIAWGRNARFVKDIDVGERLAVSGRIQSREYTKKLSETESEVRVAYELSISKITLDCNQETAATRIVTTSEN